MNRSKLLDGFQLQDNRILDQHVKPVAGNQPNPVVDKREGDFGLGLSTTGFEVGNQTDPAGTFQKARPQYGVNPQSAANDLSSQLALVHGPWASFPSPTMVYELAEGVPYYLRRQTIPQRGQEEQEQEGSTQNRNSPPATRQPPAPPLPIRSMSGSIRIVRAAMGFHNSAEHSAPTCFPHPSLELKFVSKL